MFNFQGEVLQRNVQGKGMKKARLEKSLECISSNEECATPMKELTSHLPRIVDEQEYLELALAEWENNQLDEETFNKPYISALDRYEILENGKIRLW